MNRNCRIRHLKANSRTIADSSTKVRIVFLDNRQSYYELPVGAAVGKAEEAIETRPNVGSGGSPSTNHSPLDEVGHAGAELVGVDEADSVPVGVKVVHMVDIFGKSGRIGVGVEGNDVWLFNP